MKQLEKKDLIIGEIYKHQNGNFVKYQFDGDINGKIKGSYIGNNADKFYRQPDSNFTISCLKLATPEEKHWLEVCIAANNFISYEEAMKTFIPEYVECIENCGNTRFTKNKIYKVEKNSYVDRIKLLDNDLTNSNNSGYPMNGGIWKFKPSTKEAYDAQFIVKKPEFVLPEKWFLKFKTLEIFNELCLKYKPSYSFYANAGIKSNCENLKVKLGNFYYIGNNQSYGTEITFEQFKKYVLKEQLEEPKDKVLQYCHKNSNFIKQVECAEGAIYQLGDKITVFTKDSPNKGRVLTIKDFRWNNAKTNICAITEIHNKNGIGLDKIELYSEPKIEKLSLLEQAKLKYPIGVKIKSVLSDKIIEIKNHNLFQISSNNITIGYDNGLIIIYNGEKWAEIVEDFVLPQHWCIQVTNENIEKLRNHRFGLTSGSVDGYITSQPIGSLNWGYFTHSNTDGYYREITLEQFLKYVVNE